MVRGNKIGRVSEAYKEVSLEAIVHQPKKGSLRKLPLNKANIRLVLQCQASFEGSAYCLMNMLHVRWSPL